ncbi:MAG: ABC transporter ATP-binding protein [Lachnospiraceae bacterium]
MNQKNNSIQVQHIFKSYHKQPVLSDVSLEIKEGEIFGLLGPSGCGKSTTVKIMVGILNADQGETQICGKKMPNFGMMGQIGYMAQAAALYPTLTGYENLKFFGSLYGMKKAHLQQRIQEVAQMVDLQVHLKKEVRYYSGGMKQRLSLAAALLAEPKVLVLDEPTVGIDPVLRQKIWDRLLELKQQGVTIVITTHVMDEVAKCDRFAMMRKGKILISGTADKICQAAKKESIEDAFIYFSSNGEEER